MSHRNYTTEQLEKLTDTLALTAMSEGSETLDLALSGLLSAYATLVMDDPRHLQACAEHCLRMHKVLDAHAKDYLGSASTHVH